MAVCPHVEHLQPAPQSWRVCMMAFICVSGFAMRASVSTRSFSIIKDAPGIGA